MEEKQLVRIAMLKGNGIKKRCRKSDRIFVEGIGNSDEQALENLHKALIVQINGLKSYEFEEKVVIIDGYRKGPWIERPVFYKSGEYNYKELTFIGV